MWYLWYVCKFMCLSRVIYPIEPGSTSNSNITPNSNLYHNHSKWIISGFVQLLNVLWNKICCRKKMSCSFSFVTSFCFQRLQGMSYNNALLSHCVYWQYVCVRLYVHQCCYYSQWLVYSNMFNNSSTCRLWYIHLWELMELPFNMLTLSLSQRVIFVLCFIDVH